jgi:uncharacterized protein (DUF2249 family)
VIAGVPGEQPDTFVALVFDVVGAVQPDGTVTVTSEPDPKELAALLVNVKA